MRDGYREGRVRRGGLLAALLVVLMVGSTASAQIKEDKAYSLSLGYDFSSHFVSYGLDVWGGGGHPCPWGNESTMFGYATLTAAFADNLTGFVNVWADINDNADSDIGGSIQEVDLNIGGTFTYEKFAFTLANGCWWYAGDTEHILDFTVAFNDADMLMEGFALNPSFTIHWRYEGNGSQDEGFAFVPGIKPSFTFMKESKYPITVAFPISVAFFTDDFQGGDSGFGYVSAGPAVTVPLSFIPEKFGAWSVTGSLIYYITDEDAIPSNPADSFCVGALSIGVAI